MIAWEQGVCGLGSLDSDNEDKSDVEDEQESTEERWGERKERSDLVNLNLCRTNRSLKQGVDTFITYARSSSITLPAALHYNEKFTYCNAESLVCKSFNTLHLIQCITVHLTRQRHERRKAVKK